MSALIMRPRDDGPIYVARPAKDGDGYVMVPFYPEPDRRREMTAAEVEKFRRLTCQSGGFVHGRVG